ncbi:MAG: glycosyltransferase [Candidatus Scalindua sp.]
MDETLLDQLPDGIDIYRVQRWSIVQKFKKKKSYAKQRSITDNYNGNLSLTRKIIMWLYRRTFIYDFLWLLPALRTAIRLMKTNDIKLIFSSFPNAESHILALILSLMFKVKWVCEFRDPWTMNAQQLHNCPYLLHKMNKYLEKTCIKKCHKIIVVEEYYQNYLMKIVNKRNKYELIYNGYDAEDFNNIINDKEDGYFTISYIGTFGHYRTPEYFLNALGNLLTRYPELKDEIRVLLIGESRFTPGFDEKIMEMIKKNGIGGVVERKSFLSHKKALARMIQSDVLLLIEGSVPGKNIDRKDVVTAKIFEYLFAKKPILALVPPNGSAAKIIKEANAGEIVEPTDLKSIENKLFEMYQTSKNSLKKYRLNTDYIKQFDRRIQTERLATVFDCLLSGRN